MKLSERVIKRSSKNNISILENHFGLMPDKSTTGAVHFIRRLTELYKDGKKDLHMVFIDLERVCNKVRHEVLWGCLEERNANYIYPSH